MSTDSSTMQLPCAMNDNTDTSSLRLTGFGGGSLMRVITDSDMAMDTVDVFITRSQAKLLVKWLEEELHRSRINTAEANS